ncbi:MAG TPA: hypothetical protein ACHBYY_06465 [Arsenophonus nasoniae]
MCRARKKARAGKERCRRGTKAEEHKRETLSRGKVVEMRKTRRRETIVSVILGIR